jgi:hypothetical protein
MAWISAWMTGPDTAPHELLAGILSGSGRLARYVGLIVGIIDSVYRLKLPLLQTATSAALIDYGMVLMSLCSCGFWFLRFLEKLNADYNKVAY